MLAMGWHVDKHAGVIPIAAIPLGAWSTATTGANAGSTSCVSAAVRASWSLGPESPVPVASLLPQLLLPPLPVEPPKLLRERRLLQDTSLSGADAPLKAWVGSAAVALSAVAWAIRRLAA